MRSVIHLILSAILVIALVIGVGLVLLFAAGRGGVLGVTIGALLVVASGLGLLRMPGEHRRPRKRWQFPGGAAGHAFAAELGRMLAHVAPTRIDPDRSQLHGVEGRFVIAHSDGPDWDIEVDVYAHEAIVAVAGTHEHFLEADGEPVAERPWTTQAVDFVAELMRGQIEVRRTYRGRFLARISHGRYGPDGAFEPFTTTVPLTPAALLPLGRTRVERERPNFGAA